MRKKILYFFVFTIVAILQLSVVPIVFDGKHVPDMVLMAILAWSILDGFFAFLGWAIFFGIYYDLVSYSSVGVHALIFLIVVYFVSFFFRRLTLDFKGLGAALFLVYVIAATVISHLVIALFQSLNSTSPRDFWEMFGSIAGVTIEVIFNVGIFFVCFWLIKKIKQFYSIEI